MRRIKYKYHVNSQREKKSNIAEYILYMWQVEDMLRGLGLDINRVKNELIARFQVDEKRHRKCTTGMTI